MVPMTEQRAGLARDEGHMDPVVDTSAPAPEPVPDTIPATEAAVVADNFQDFEAAEFAKAAGKPLPAVAASAPVERALSKRQQEANERTQKAVEAATADLRAENARLKAATPAPVAPARVEPVAPVAPAAKPDRFQTFEQFVAKTPDATLEDYMDARDEFRDQQRERTTAARTEQQTLDHLESTRIARVDEQLKTRIAADPDFTTKINPRILTFKSIADSVAAGVPVTPGSLVLEEMMGSEAFLPFADHFTAHPDALARLEAVPAHLATLPPRQRALEHGRWIVREMSKLETTLAPPAAAADDAPPLTPKPKTISSAPPPPVDLGRRATTPADPIAAAIKADDYAAFETAEFARLKAARM